LFLIAGSGRSGTSAVARLLHEAGFGAGHDLIGPDESNAEGYFEERAVVELNDAILNAVGLNEWFTTASRPEILAAAAPHAEAMRLLVAEATPAWKWMQHLPDPPRLIVCLRSPSEVVASTLRYYGQEGDEATRAVEHTWRAEYERLLEIIGEKRLDAMCVEFDRLYRAPKTTVRGISKFVGRPLDASLVRRDLRHHRRPIPEHLRELYERVRGLGG
jgi:hypothetical protein